MALTKKLSLLCMSILTAGFVAESDAMILQANNNLNNDYLNQGESYHKPSWNYSQYNNKFSNNSTFDNSFDDRIEVPGVDSFLDFSDIFDAMANAKANAKHINNNFVHSTFKQELITNLQLILKYIESTHVKNRFMNIVSGIMKKYNVSLHLEDGSNNFYNLSVQRTSSTKFMINTFTENLLSKFLSINTSNGLAVTDVYNFLLEMCQENSSNNVLSNYIMKFMILNMNMEQKWNLFELCQQAILTTGQNSELRPIMLKVMYELSYILSFDALQNNNSELTDKVVLEAIRLQRAISKNKDPNYISMYKTLPEIISEIPNVNAVNDLIQENIIEYNMRKRSVHYLYDTQCSFESKFLDALHCAVSVTGVENHGISKYNYYNSNRLVYNNLQKTQVADVKKQRIRALLFDNNNRFENIEYNTICNLELKRDADHQINKRFSRVKEEPGTVHINLPYRRPLPGDDNVSSKPINAINLPQISKMLRIELSNELAKKTQDIATIKKLRRLNLNGMIGFYDIMRVLCNPSTEEEKNTKEVIEACIKKNNPASMIKKNAEVALMQVHNSGTLLQSIVNHLAQKGRLCTTQMLLPYEMFQNFKNNIKLILQYNSNSINIAQSISRVLSEKEIISQQDKKYIICDREDIAKVLVNVYSLLSNDATDTFVKLFNNIPVVYLNQLFVNLINTGNKNVSYYDLINQLKKLIQAMTDGRFYVDYYDLNMRLSIIERCLRENHLNNNNQNFINMLINKMKKKTLQHFKEQSNHITSLTNSIVPYTNVVSSKSQLVNLVNYFNNNMNSLNSSNNIWCQNNWLENTINDYLGVTNIQDSDITSIKDTIEKKCGLKTELLLYKIVAFYIMQLSNSSITDDSIPMYSYGKDGKLNLMDIIHCCGNISNKDEEALMVNICENSPYLKYVLQENKQKVLNFNTELNSIYNSKVQAMKLSMSSQQLTRSDIDRVIKAINQMLEKYNSSLCVHNIEKIIPIILKFEEKNNILINFNGLQFYCLMQYVDQLVSSTYLNYQNSSMMLYSGDYYKIQIMSKIFKIVSQEIYDANTADWKIRLNNITKECRPAFSRALKQQSDNGSLLFLLKKIMPRNELNDDAVTTSYDSYCLEELNNNLGSNIHNNQNTQNINQNLEINNVNNAGMNNNSRYVMIPQMSNNVDSQRQWHNNLNNQNTQNINQNLEINNVNNAGMNNNSRNVNLQMQRHNNSNNQNIRNINQNLEINNVNNAGMNNTSRNVNLQMQRHNNPNNIHNNNGTNSNKIKKGFAENIKNNLNLDSIDNLQQAQLRLQQERSYLINNFLNNNDVDGNDMLDANQELEDINTLYNYIHQKILKLQLQNNNFYNNEQHEQEEYKQEENNEQHEQEEYKQEENDQDDLAKSNGSLHLKQDSMLL